jgi:ACR3 family arsenite efflux pump ArsB
MIWNVLAWFQKNLIWSIPLAMLGGLLFGIFVQPGFLKAAIMPLTFLMVYPMMVTMNVRDLLKPGGNRLQMVTQAINFLLMPAIGFGMGMLFFPDQPMTRLALLLTALLPTSGMTISWTGFAKGNVPAAVKMTVIGLMAGSLLAPLYLKLLLGAVVEIPLLQVFMQIALIVFLPLVLGTLTRQWLVKNSGELEFNQSIKPKFPPVSTLGVLGIVFVSMALKSRGIVSHPALLPSLLLPLVLIYILNFVISTIVGKAMFQRSDAIALVYGTVMRNLSIALAIALGVFGAKGADAALLIALAYIVQVQAAAWYVKFTDRLFGAAPAPAGPVPSAAAKSA